MFARCACILVLVATLAGHAAEAAPPLEQLFYGRQWKEFDQALELKADWTAREACLAANAAWLRQDWEKSLRILNRHRKKIPGEILPYADLLRALGLERTGKGTEAGRLAKRIWDATPPAELRFYVAYLCLRQAPSAQKAGWARKMLESAGSDSGRKTQALSQVLSLGKGTEAEALALLEIRPLDRIALDALRTKGRSREALEALGLASALSGDPEEAVVIFGRAVPANGDPSALSPKGRYWLALSLYRSGRREEAVLLWEDLADSGGAYAVSSTRRMASAAASGTVGARPALERLAMRSGDVAEAALFSLASSEGEESASPWVEALLSKFPGTAGASRLLWKSGWKAWLEGETRRAQSDWQRALQGAPEGLENARLLFWLSKCSRKLGDEEEARRWEARLASEEPLSYYAWRVFPKGPPGIPVKGRKEWTSGRDALESWGFPVYSMLRLEASAKGEKLARAAWLAAWNGDYAESFRLASRARPLLSKSESLSPAFLSLSYPRAYSREVLEASTRFSVEPGLVWATMRQESGFDSLAVSSAGAAGLMQLMPQTARDEASRLGLDEKEDFLVPKTNVLLGAAHLARHRDSFGRVDQALAAYNAGGTNARRWVDKGSEDPEEWVEEIGYPETNEYVKKVLGNLSIYRALDGGHE
jgi:soluble lytic murein transglycosylase